MVLWNDLIDKIKISEIIYDKSKRKKRAIAYVGFILFCILLWGTTYIEARILIDKTEYEKYLPIIIIMTLSIFLTISSLFSVRYILYSEIEILRMAPLPLSTIEIIIIKTLEIVLKNGLLSLLLCSSFSVVLFDSIVDVISFLICCALMLPIATYNVAHAILVLFKRGGVFTTKNRKIAITVFLVNITGLYIVLNDEPINIGHLLTVIIVLILSYFFHTISINCHFFKIVEKLQKKSRTYNSEKGSYDKKKLLFQKELKMYLNNRLFVVNSSFGAFMLLIVALLIVALPVNGMFADNGVIIEYFYNSIPLIFALIISTCCTTYCSFSLEGKTAWIYQKLPITILEIVTAKVKVNLLVSFPVIIISACIVIVKTIRLSCIVLIMSFILPIMSSVFVACLGCFIDMSMCNLEWKNPQVLIKQTKTYPMTIFIGMYLPGLCETGIIFGTPKIGVDVVYIFILALYLIVIGCVLWGLKNKALKFSYMMK